MTLIPTPEHEFHLKDYLKVLRRHRWLIVGLFSVTVLTATIWNFMQLPIYQASATVLIEPEPPRVLNIQDVMPLSSPAEDYYRTQYEIIKSRPVAEKVIESRNLKTRFPEITRAAQPARAIPGALTVEPKRNTRLVMVTYESADPVFAAEMATAFAHAYVRHNIELKLKGAKDAMAWLNDQMAGLKARVQESSVALQNYRVKAGILGMQEQRQITTSKIMEFNRAYLDAQAQRLSIEAKLKEITRIARDKTTAQSIFTVADNPLIEKLRAEASDLEIQRSKLLKTFKEKHPEILKVDAQLQQVTQKFDAEIQNLLRAVQTQYEVARGREETLLRNVNQLKQEAQDLNEKEIQYLTLQRESDSTQQLYEAVLKRLKETGVAGGIENNNVSVVEDAVTPTVPVKPKKFLNIAISVVIAAVVGVGVALAIEYFDTTIKSPEEIERGLGLPVIAVVPIFR